MQVLFTIFLLFLYMAELIRFTPTPGKRRMSGSIPYFLEKKVPKPPIWCRSNRGEIRFANLALISGRQMSIRASTMSIFLVAMTKNDCCFRNSHLYFHALSGVTFFWRGHVGIEPTQDALNAPH